MLWILLAKHDFAGIQLLIDRNEEETSLKAVSDALAMIKVFDLRTFKLIQNNFDRIAVVQKATHARAWYLPDKRACCLRLNYVQNCYADELALSIIHELTHARLCQLGFEYKDPVIFRVEEICIRRELAFARRLEDCGFPCFDHVGTLTKHLEKRSPGLYSEDGFKAKARRDELLGLRHMKTAPCPLCVRGYLVRKVRRCRQEQREHR